MSAAAVPGSWNDDEALARRLLEARGAAGRARVAAGHIDGERMLAAVVDPEAGLQWGDQALATPVCVGCFAKLFTASLVAHHCALGTADLDTPIGRELPNLSRSHQQLLSGVTLRHLLNHSHGLDGAALWRAPTKGDGCVDVESLCGVLAHNGRLFEPGELYSYSNAGAWLAAAVLEQRSGVPFAVMLKEQLLDPLGIDLMAGRTCPSHGAVPDFFCPAMGGRSAISVGGLLRFLRFHLDGGAGSRIAQIMRDRPVTLPGWATESAATIGWKVYREGLWYGHGSDSSGCSAVMRVRPDAAVGFVTWSAGRGAFLLHGKVFGTFSEDPAEMKWCRSTPLPCSPARYTGIYRNSVYRLCVQSGAADSDALLLSARLMGNAAVQAGLWHSQDNLFTVRTARTAPPRAWFQFVCPDSSGFRFLWDGRHLLRRTQSGEGLDACGIVHPGSC